MVNLIWSKNNLAPFNSQIKIYKDKFFIIDFSNTLRCFSLKDGKELWNIKTENSLIRSQKNFQWLLLMIYYILKILLGILVLLILNTGEFYGNYQHKVVQFIKQLFLWKLQI